jgi:hypothetical protein
MTLIVCVGSNPSYSFSLASHRRFTNQPTQKWTLPLSIRLSIHRIQKKIDSHLIDYLFLDLFVSNSSTTLFCCGNVERLLLVLLHTATFCSIWKSLKIFISFHFNVFLWRMFFCPHLKCYKHTHTHTHSLQIRSLLSSLFFFISVSYDIDRQSTLLMWFC